MFDQLAVKDVLEIRNIEGETLCITPICSIDKDMIETDFGLFNITGKKNIAGIETYQHVADNEEVNSIFHAVAVELTLLEETLINTAVLYYDKAEAFSIEDGRGEYMEISIASCLTLCRLAHCVDSGFSTRAERQLRMIEEKAGRISHKHSNLPSFRR